MNPIQFYEFGKNRGGLKGINTSALALSLRKLNGSYSGYCVRVRRSSDNSEMDIPFSGVSIDQTALLSFTGSGNGFVRTWYDQSGNGRNATQTINGNQPQIVVSGVVCLNLGKPTIKFNGSTWMDLPSNYSVSAVSLYHVSSLYTGSANYCGVIYHAPTSGTGFALTHSYGTTYVPVFMRLVNGTNPEPSWGDGSYAAPTFPVTRPLNVQSWHWSGGALSTTVLKEYINTGQRSITAGESSWGSFSGAGLNKSYAATKGIFDISEVFYWSSYNLSDVSAINSNIKTYYGI